jgi:hypothetical protein
LATQKLIRHPWPNAQAAGTASRDPSLLNEKFQTGSETYKTKLRIKKSIFFKKLKILKKNIVLNIILMQ